MKDRGKAKGRRGDERTETLQADNEQQDKGAWTKANRERLAYLSLAVERMAEMVIVTDLDHTITYANPAAEKILGYNPRELIGSKAADFFEGIPGNPPNLRELIAARQEKGIFRGELFNRKKDGSLIQVHLTLNWLRDEGGEIIGCVAISRDITDQKRVEESLRKSEEKYRLTSQNIPVVVYSALPDENSTNLFLSGRARELTGYTVQEFLDNPDLWPSILHPEDRELVWKSIEDHRLNKKMLDVEYRIMTRDGITKWVRDKARPTLDENGEIARIDGFMEDITERRLVEENLRKSRDYLDRVLNSIIEGVMVIDRDYTIQAVNECFLRQFRRGREEVIGRKCHEVTHDTDIPCTGSGNICPLNDVFASGRACSAEHIHFDAGGGKHVSEVNAFPLLDEEGEISAVVELIHDVTEQKALQEQLLHAQKMEAVGTLAGGIAHDFNNILAGIMGYIALVKRGLEKDSPLAEDMESIEKLSRRAADLTGALLTFARKGMYYPRPLDLNRVATSVLKVIGRTANKGITIETEMPPHVPNIEADEGQIHQLLMNLCINACEAMPNGGTLTLRTAGAKTDEAFFARHPGLREGDYVAISVSDTGCGMDAGTKARIFEPFYTTKEETSGTGLGLAMVIGIVEGHGGCIEIESVPGTGSRFTVFLPATAKEIQPDEAKPVGTLRGEETILLVDDEKCYRDSIGWFLGELGYTVLEAQNGREALGVLHEKGRAVELVLLDMIMEGMSGAETFERIRGILPGIPVIICTGFTLDAASRKLLEREPCRFLQKPLLPEELALTVRKIIDGR